MNVEAIIEALATLRLDELRRVRAATDEWIALTEERQSPDWTPGPPAERKTYIQEYVKCGKRTCKNCSAGQGHGPYWYAYWTVEGKTRKQYIGKELPAER
jgi:hypothetical protein